MITTAPTDHQVKNLLWGEIGRLHTPNTGYELAGDPDQKQIRLGPKWYCLGLSTNKPGRFQGFHGSVEVPDDPDEDIDLEEYQRRLEEAQEQIREAQDKKGAGGLLFIFDEAAGIDQAIYDAAKGALTSPDSFVLMIGNPDLDVAAEHEFVRTHGLDSEFFRIRVGVELGPEDPFEPAVGSESREKWREFHKVPKWLMRPEWIEERKKDYGEGTPLYYSKIWGLFAGADATARVMPLELLQASENHECNAWIGGCHIGVDVGGEGGDRSVATLVVNGKVRAQHTWLPRAGDVAPLMTVVNTVKAVRNKWGEQMAEEMGRRLHQVLPWDHVHIENNGVGAGVCSRFHQLGLPVDKVDMGELPTGAWKDVCGEVGFKNRRAELHWAVRRLAEEGMFSMSREYRDAWSQAQWTEFENVHQSGGTKLVMTPKRDIRKAYGRSPDEWDSVILAFARRRKLKFGRR